MESLDFSVVICLTPQEEIYIYIHTSRVWYVYIHYNILYVCVCIHIQTYTCMCNIYISVCVCVYTAFFEVLTDNFHLLLIFIHPYIPDHVPKHSEKFICVIPRT